MQVQVCISIRVRSCSAGFMNSKITLSGSLEIFLIYLNFYDASLHSSGTDVHCLHSSSGSMGSSRPCNRCDYRAELSDASRPGVCVEHTWYRRVNGFSCKLGGHVSINCCGEI